jgi:hypothetical protein
MKVGALSEKAIHSAVLAHWTALGVPGTLLATIPNMRAAGQAGLTKGLPDLLCIGPQGVGFIELKTLTGAPSKAQLHILGICERWGVPWAISHGRDEPIAVLERWGLVRRAAG